jgi:MFS family permease
LNNIIQKTHFLDSLRSFLYGLLEAGWQTFAFIVAIRYFQADTNFKSLIAAAGPIGFLITPLSLYFFAGKRILASSAASLIYFLTAAFLLASVSVNSLFVFGSFVILSLIINVQKGPVLLDIYTTNYPPNQRGHYMKYPNVLSAVSAILFGFIGGKFLDANIENYTIVFIVMAIVAFAAGLIVKAIPSEPFSRDNIGNPFQSISLIWKDKLFGSMLGAWMILGIGNLICLPIRYEYLANPEYGLDINNTQIALIMIAIPAVAKILSTFLWANLFDKLKLITTRNLNNWFFLLSVILFFLSDNLILISIASACQGIALGGGKIFWNLWVTKIASAKKVSSYMSVHMALTGIRGSFAPFLGYAILVSSSPLTVAIIGSLLILISILMFEQYKNHPRLANNGN